MTMSPANHREAMLRSDAEEWKKVENKELEMLKSMGVYVDEKLPKGRKVIGNLWVFKFKLDVDGGPPIHKTCLVAQRFSHVPFVDYNATFVPVAKSASMRFVAIHSALHRSPEGLRGVWHLLKSLYGLKQASLIWYKLLRKVLESLGFIHSEFDHAVFVYKHLWGGKEVHCLLAMHRRRSCWLHVDGFPDVHQGGN